MPKSTSTDLFELIQSLTRSEKRYFKLYAENNTIGTHNHYVMLFDAIAKQKEYDESTLKRTFKYSIKNFKATKYQLYRLILHSLNAFYKNQTELSKILNNLQAIEILEKKNLHKQSAALLQKTKKIATENNLTEYVDAALDAISEANNEDEPNPGENNKPWKSEPVSVADREFSNS